MLCLKQTNKKTNRSVVFFSSVFCSNKKLFLLLQQDDSDSSGGESTEAVRLLFLNYWVSPVVTFRFNQAVGPDLENTNAQCLSFHSHQDDPFSGLFVPLFAPSWKGSRLLDLPDCEPEVSNVSCTKISLQQAQP